MYNLTGKGRQIQQMFGDIAPRYDFLNRLLSFGIDRRWRKKAVQEIHRSPSAKILDIATGTGDVALEIAKQMPSSISITGIDFSGEMIALAREKVEARELSPRISFTVAPCEEIPFPEATFDAITIAFGIRNVIDRNLGLQEMHRVLKSGGQVIILEFSTPKSAFFRWIYHFYFHTILPRIASLFSRFEAYKYLPESVSEFPDTKKFKEMMTNAGFINVRHKSLTFGISTIYVGEKP